jgi:LDH2 family malate/lactate/ureidoglycolate dehydrogenase
LPAAGPKGFGLAFVIDLLCGGLSDGAVGAEVRPLYGDPAEPYRCAHFFLAIDIGRFRPVEELAAAAEVLASRVRASRPAPNGGPVRMPGDRALVAAAAHASRCPLARSTLESLIKLAGRLNVSVPPSLAS